jgi:hypothetical protein
MVMALDNDNIKCYSKILFILAVSSFWVPKQVAHHPSTQADVSLLDSGDHSSLDSIGKCWYYGKTGELDGNKMEGEILYWLLWLSIKH